MDGLSFLLPGIDLFESSSVETVRDGNDRVIACRAKPALPRTLDRWLARLQNCCDDHRQHIRLERFSLLLRWGRFGSDD